MYCVMNLLEKIMNNEIPRLPGETDYLYEQRCKCIRYLGSKWILAEKMQKPKEAIWKG